MLTFSVVMDTGVVPGSPTMTENNFGGSNASIFNIDYGVYNGEFDSAYE